MDAITRLSGTSICRTDDRANSRVRWIVFWLCRPVGDQKIRLVNALEHLGRPAIQMRAPWSLQALLGEGGTRSSKKYAGGGTLIE